MFKEIILVALAVVVAQCALPAIPIAKQGKDFPVPIVDEKITDDFFDDRFYPDIDDERVGPKAPEGTRKPHKKETIPPPRGDQIEGPQVPGGRTPPRAPGKVGQGASTGTKNQTPGSLANRNPTGSGTRSRDRELVIRDKTPSGGQAGKPERQGSGKKQDLSRFKNAPAKLIFKSSNFDTTGKTPYAQRLFKTQKPQTVIAKGDPNDVYVLELLDGDYQNLSLGIKIMGRSKSIATLHNPNRNAIVGRIKTYKGLR